LRPPRRANKRRIDQLLHESLMLVTALNPIIGFNNAAAAAAAAVTQHVTNLFIILLRLTATQGQQAPH
jgi:fumarate hydratase class II